MTLWRPLSWTWRDARNLWEYLSAVAGACCGAWTVLADPEYKKLPATLTAFAGVSTLTATFVSRCFEQRANVKREAKALGQMKRVTAAILEAMRREYFAREVDEERSKHRITLFVCVERSGRTEQNKRLEIFSRAGVWLNSTCTWPVDENHPDRCRGVAGKIWYHWNTDIKIAACDWPENGDPILKTRYAQSLDMTVEEAEGLNVKSRAFAGTPIMVNGRKWGVLLLDSLKVGFIANKPHQKGIQNRYTNLIGSILTEAGI